MTKKHKYIFNLIIALFVVPFALTAGETEQKAIGEAELKAAYELMDSCQFEKTMNEAIDKTIEMVKNMDPNLADKEAQLRKYYEKYMSPSVLRKDVAEMYAEVFTEQELKDLTAFYKTSTGQKTIEKLPQVMQFSMQRAQANIMEHMGELEAILSQEEVAKN